MTVYTRNADLIGCAHPDGIPRRTLQRSRFDDRIETQFGVARDNSQVRGVSLDKVHWRAEAPGRRPTTLDTHWRQCKSDPAPGTTRDANPHIHTHASGPEPHAFFLPVVASDRTSMASRVTVKQMRSELKRRGLPIHGTKQMLADRCRQNGVSCAGPAITRTDGSTSGARSGALPPPSNPGSPAPDEPRPSPPRRTPAGQSGAPSDPDATVPAAATPAQVSAESGGTAAIQPSPDRQPPFTKHERARLAHVMCHGEVAAGVIVSRGPMSRQQVDSRSSRTEVWPVVVAEVFNGPEVFTVPAACADAAIDPNLHTVRRTGQFLRAKWTEVCSQRDLFIGPA